MACGINQDFDMYAGDDQNIGITIKDALGGNMNLTDVNAIQWIMKKYALSSGSLIEKNVGSGVTILTAASGEVRVELYSADTQSVTPGPYYHEMRVKDSSNNISTVLTGTMTIYPTEPL